VWQNIGVIFCEQFSKFRSHNCYLLLGFSLHLRDLWLNFFQITKGLRFNSYPFSLPSFSFSPLAVNPVGVITYWCYFLRIIVYNFMTIYAITTKFGIRMCLYSAFLCTKFQGNWIMHLCFITTFTPWRKENNEEIKPIFEGSYLGNTRCDLVKIWNVRWWHWSAFSLQKLFCFVKVSWNYVNVRIVFLFFLLITHGCGAPASWAARHTTMCFDLNFTKWTHSTIPVWQDCSTDCDISKTVTHYICAKIFEIGLWVNLLLVECIGIQL